MLFQAAKEIDQGKAMHAIVERWTRAGVPTVEGKGRWHQKVLRRTLISPRMVGKRELEGGLIDIEYMPPILPEELWRRVRAKLLDNKKRGPGESRELTNIALCGICGLPLVAQIDRAGPMYLCKRRPSQPSACGGIVILVCNLDMKVDENVIAFLNDKQRANALFDTHRLQTPEMAALDARSAQLAENKAALEGARFNPPQGVERLDEDRYYELLAEIKRELEQIQRRRAVNREALPLKEALRHNWTIEQWRSRALEWRRDVIRLVVERIEVSPTPRRGAEKGHLGGVHNPDRIKVKLAG